MGHSIVGDTQYGGERVDEEKCNLETVVGLMQSAARAESDNNTTNGSSTEKSQNESSINVTDSKPATTNAESARKACRCCESIEDNFSAAHLLQGGHAIRLHAWRYRVKFISRKMRNGEFAVLAEAEYAVAGPTWVDPSLLQNVSWF
jgi:hypothetical protein